MTYRPPLSVYSAHSTCLCLGNAISNAALASAGRDPDGVLDRLDRARAEIARALEAVDAAIGDLRPVVQPETFKKLGPVAAVALSDQLADSPAVQRLVPRMPAVKSAGSMGTVAPVVTEPGAA